MEHLGEPIQIIKLNARTGKQELNDKVLKEIFLDENLQNVVLSVVSIAGAFRKGKSFMLSFFLRFLEFFYGDDSGDEIGNNEWLGDDSLPLAGFAWRSGFERHTIGIWMWSKIFTKTMPNGQKIGIVLLDTQGMFDNQTDMNSNLIIFALSTMLSSIQIFNLTSNIQEDDLQHLKLFTEYGRMAKENSESDSKPFQQLMFLVRDWSFPDDFSYGLMGGISFLKQQVLNIKPGSPAEIKAVRKYLESCFDETSCFLMPSPGDKVRTSKSFDGRLCDINPQFVKHLNDLVFYLLKPENISKSGLKMLNGNKIKPEDFLNLIQQYWKVFKNGKLPEIKNILEASTEVSCLSTRTDIFQSYCKEMLSLVQSNNSNVTQLLDKHKILIGEALTNYDSRVIMGDEEIRKQHRRELQNVLHEQITFFLGMNYSTKTTSLEETISTLSENIDQLKLNSKASGNVDIISSIQIKLLDFLELSQVHQMERIKHMNSYYNKTVDVLAQNTVTRGPTKEHRQNRCLIM